MLLGWVRTLCVNDHMVASFFDKKIPFLLQVTSGFELYATFNPLVTKPIAINAINRLLKWITVSPSLLLSYLSVPDYFKLVS